ncbi:hypothetical protein HKW98_06830 [Stutzerimonas urumqiensis]
MDAFEQAPWRGQLDAVSFALTMVLARCRAVSSHRCCPANLWRPSRSCCSTSPSPRSTESAQTRRLTAEVLAAQPRMAKICVTHDPVDAEALASRVWYLDGKPATLQRDLRMSAGLLRSGG